jgi:dTDP-4-dehydrorhamnose 3,5-epimerase
MKITECHLQSLYLIEFEVYHDKRGFFIERFNQQKFKSAGLDINFVQLNHSRSLPNVVRGLHLQTDPAQGKLVSVIKGKIFDVAVDIRPNSKTFGQHYSVELSEDNAKALWIPAGFAHGFCVLGQEVADVIYSVDAHFNPNNNRGIIWNDAELDVNWPVENPIISDKDVDLPSFSDYKNTY